MSGTRGAEAAGPGNGGTNHGRTSHARTKHPGTRSAGLVAPRAYGLAPGQAPSAAALSGPLISLIPAAILLADRRRFAAAEA